MHINLLKRLESSVDSFRKTAFGIVSQIENTIAALDRGETESLTSVNIDTDDENFDWDSNWGDEENVIGKKIKVHLADVDRVQWKEDLQEDLEVLNFLLQKALQIVPQYDHKLQTLMQRIENKVKKPFNTNNKKIIIFTAFADTANYLYSNLSGYFKDKYQLNSALISA